eukprot:1622024-Alexandrium_andersonii.AAC.1
MSTAFLHADVLQEVFVWPPAGVLQEDRHCFRQDRMEAQEGHVRTSIRTCFMAEPLGGLLDQAWLRPLQD